MSIEKKQNDTLDALKAKFSNQLFDLGRITYQYEAQRRLAVDTLSTTANELAEAAKALQGTVDAAAAIKEDTNVEAKP